MERRVFFCLTICDWRLAFDRTGEEAAHEIALEREKDKERHNHRDERARRENIPLAVARADQVSETQGQHLNFRFCAKENQRDKVIIPDPQELKDRKRGERRRRERENETSKDGEMGCAVNER